MGWKDIALVRNRADLDWRSFAGWMALMYASRDPSHGIDVAGTLLALGANPGIVNGPGQTARHLAQEPGSTELARLLEAAEVLFEAAGPVGWFEITSARTARGYFAFALVKPDDLVLARRTDDGAETIFRLQEHTGLTTHFEDLRLPGRWLLTRYVLVDADGDEVPDVLLRGACECHGYVVHALVNGATGAALSVDAYPRANPDDGLLLHAYQFPSAAPTAMRQFLAGALAAEEDSHGLEEAPGVVRPVRLISP
jgi:hypothetical protein